jgi:adenylate cyclase
LDERAALLSGHWEAAGDALQAARWSRRAADWVGIRNRAEAVDHWRRAIDLLRGAPDVDEATELAVTARASLLGSGTVAGLLSDDEVETLYTDGVKLAAGLTDVRPLANLEAAYGAALGNTSAAAVEHRLRGLEIADRTDDRGLRASMRSGLALVLVLLGRADEAIAMCRVALDLIGDDVDLGRGFTGARPATRARGSMAYALMETGRMQEATTAIDEMERLARALGEDEDLALALTFRNLHDWRTGHAQRALARAPQARELLERTGAPGFRVMGHRMHASLLVELERWDEAREAIDAALGILRAGRQAVRGPEASILALLAVTQLGMGDPDEALATAEQAVDLAIERSTPLTEVQTRIHAARVTNATGALDRTREHLDRALEIVRETGTATYEPSVRLEYAELARLRGDVAVQASELQDAHRLYTEMGITKRAEGVERQLTDLGALEGH